MKDDSIYHLNFPQQEWILWVVEKDFGGCWKIEIETGIKKVLFQIIGIQDVGETNTKITSKN